MKILKINIQNFKLLTEVEVETGGKSVIVTGPNETGKSSFIDAVFDLLSNGDLPPQPIKSGETNASIKVEVGEERTQYIVTRTFTEANKKGYLTIETPDGAKYSKPVEHLEKLFGTITFDMDGLLQSKNNKEMLVKLKSFLNINTADLDAERKTIYDERTGINREIETLKPFIKEPDAEIQIKVKRKVELEDLIVGAEPKLKEIEVLKSRIEKGKTLISDKKFEIKETVSVIDFNNKSNSERSESVLKLQAEIKRINDDIQKLEADIVTGHKVIDEQKIKQKTLSETLEQAEKFLPTVEAEKEKLDGEVNIDAYKLELTNIETAIQSDITNAANIEKVEIKTKESVAKTEKIKELDVKINELFKASSTEELTITEDGVLYKGLPLDIKQINSASFVRLALKLAMKSNSKLQSVRFDASLMDNKTYKKVLKEIDEAGFQAFIEMVDKDGENLQIQLEETLVK